MILTVPRDYRREYWMMSISDKVGLNRSRDPNRIESGDGLTGKHGL